MEAIFSRSSVRRYTEQKLSKEQITKILHAGMAAPSSVNQQPWEFIVVESDEIREKLGTMTKFTKPAGRAPVVIALLGNKKRMEYPENWEQDMGACCENMWLEAEYLGLGAVWLGIHPFEDEISKVKEILKFSDDYMPYSLLCIGYKTEETVKKHEFDMSRVTWL